MVRVWCGGWRDVDELRLVDMLMRAKERYQGPFRNDFLFVALNLNNSMTFNFSRCLKELSRDIMCCY